MAKRASKKPLTKAQQRRLAKKHEKEQFERELIRGRDFSYAAVHLGFAELVSKAVEREHALMSKGKHIFQGEDGMVQGDSILPGYQEDLDLLEKSAAWSRHEGLSELARWVREDGEEWLFEFPYRLAKSFATTHEKLIEKLQDNRRR